MSARLTIRDETPAGVLLQSYSLLFPSECTTIGDVIRARVRHEVEAYNSDAGTSVFRGLVDPDATFRPPSASATTKRSIDADRQVDAALAAFERNGFLVLVGDRQAEGIDEVVLIQPGTEVSFVKLVPLVGG